MRAGCALATLLVVALSAAPHTASALSLRVAGLARTALRLRGAGFELGEVQTLDATLDARMQERLHYEFDKDSASSLARAQRGLDSPGADETPGGEEGADVADGFPLDPRAWVLDPVHHVGLRVPAHVEQTRSPKSRFAVGEIAAAAGADGQWRFARVLADVGGDFTKGGVDAGHQYKLLLGQVPSPAPPCARSRAAGGAGRDAGVCHSLPESGGPAPQPRAANNSRGRSPGQGRGAAGGVRRGHWETSCGGGRGS
jgi:hypothetical protein